MTQIHYLQLRYYLFLISTAIDVLIVNILSDGKYNNKMTKKTYFYITFIKYLQFHPLFVIMIHYLLAFSLIVITQKLSMTTTWIASSRVSRVDCILRLQILVLFSRIEAWASLVAECTVTNNQGIGMLLFQFCQQNQH